MDMQVVRGIFINDESGSLYFVLNFIVLHILSVSYCLQ